MNNNNNDNNNNNNKIRKIINLGQNRGSQTLSKCYINE